MLRRILGVVSVAICDCQLQRAQWWLLRCLILIIILKRFTMSDVTDVAMTTISVRLSRVSSNVTVASCLIGTHHILVVSFISIISINNYICWFGYRLRLLMGLLLLMVLLALLILIRLKSLFQGLFLKNPIVHEVEVESFSDKCFSEHGYDLLVVGTLFEFKLPRVIEEVPELFWEATRQILDTGNGFLHFDLFIFLFFCLCW